MQSTLSSTLQSIPLNGDRLYKSFRIGIVTHYIPPHIGGIELLAESLFHKYRSAGCEVRWIASRVPTSAPQREDGRIRARCLNLTERWLSVPWPVWGVGGLRELARLVKWADVVHVHDCLYFGSAAAVLFARLAGKPVVLSQHIGFGVYSSATLNLIETIAYKTLGRAVLRNASQLVFCTPASEEYITSLLGDRSPSVCKIPYGIDTDRFQPASPSERAEARRRLNVPDSKPVALFVGRLMEKKGAAIFLELSRRMEDYHFLVVGDGVIRPHSADNLTWIPYVEPQQMETVYRAADAFLLPSYSEGFPFSVIEAMASGVPVIVPAGDAYTELLERESAGIVTDRAPEALHQALTRLKESPDSAKCMIERARALVAERWSLDTMCNRYLDLIEELIAESSPSKAEYTQEETR